MGVVTLGVVSGLELGYSCALLMVLAHGVCSPILFALAHLLYLSSHSRVINNNKGRLATPALAVFLFLLLAINIGLPPSINLWSEVYMFVRLLSIITLRSALLVVTAFLRVVYNLYMYVSLAQAREFDYVKIDHQWWPALSAIVLGFLLSLGLRGLSF